MKEQPKNELAKTGGSVGFDPATILAADARLKAGKALVAGTDMQERMANWNAEAEGLTIAEIHALDSMGERVAVLSGMRLYALRERLSHGTWMEYCAEHFPQITLRTIQRQILQFRRSTGKALPGKGKQKQLTQLDEDALDDPEMQRQLADPTAPVKSFSEVIAELAKLQKAQAKGREQLEKMRGELEKALAEKERLSTDLFLLPGIKDEAMRVEHVRAKFAEFLMMWCKNLPEDLDALRLHQGLHGELCERLQGLWADEMFPHGRRVQDAQRRRKERNEKSAE